MRARLACLAAVGCVLVAASARAQRLVPGLEGPVPLHLDGVLGPIEENGALVVLGADLTDRARRSLRIDATSVTAGPGIPSDRVASVVACAGTRWLVTFGPDPRGARWSVGIAGAAPTWSRSTPQGARAIRAELVTDVEARCAEDRVVVGYVSDGELVTQTLTPAPGPERRVRVGAPGVGTTVRWAAAAPDEVDVVAQSPTSASTELLRVVGGRITHRRPLGRSMAVSLAVRARDVLVTTEDPAGAGVSVRSFARADLAPGRVTRISAAPGHDGIQPVGLWPGPDGVVAVATIEGWRGPDVVAVDPDHYGQARHHSFSLRLWTPRTGAVGPAMELGEGDSHATAWLGASLIVWQGAATTASSAAGVTLGPTRIRRFTVAR